MTESGVSIYYFYDATDALVTKNATNTAPTTGTTCATLGFCYDAFGSLTSSTPSRLDASSGGSPLDVPTTYAYDPAGHLSAITDGTAADTVSFSIDALGRHGSQTIGTNPSLTYSYLGVSSSITTITSSGGTTYSTIDAIGDRLATGTGTSLAWIVPDLHGNVAPAIACPNGSAPIFVNAFRFDLYGQTVASWTATSGSVSIPWRYQGRILESAGSSTSTDLYDFGSRSYDPSLGTFTSFDSVSGSAQNPLTLNRYLYANGNPVTLVDPDGHRTCTYVSGSDASCSSGEWDNFDAPVVTKTTTKRTKKQQNNEWDNFDVGTVHNEWDDFEKKKTHNEWDDFHKDHNEWDDFQAPTVHVPRYVILQMKQCAADGNFASQSCLALTNEGILPRGGSIHTALAILSFVPGIGTYAALANGVLFLAEGDPGDAGLAASAAIPFEKVAGKAAEIALGAERVANVGTELDRLKQLAGQACALSFKFDTLVATAAGGIAISALRVGDTVLAYDPKTGETGPHTVSAVMTNLDPVVEHLALDTGSIETTPNHPFFTTDRGWVLAGSLQVGEQVRTETGGSATILGFTTTATPTTMWDLTVDGAHSFFVGQGAVLVHNAICDPKNGIPYSVDQTPTIPGRVNEFQPYEYYSMDPMEVPWPAAGSGTFKVAAAIAGTVVAAGYAGDLLTSAPRPPLPSCGSTFCMRAAP